MTTEAPAQSGRHEPVPTGTTDGVEAPYNHDKTYVITAVVLAVLTVVEVLTHTHPDFPLWSGRLVIPVLLILMAIKFWIVAWVFMHLKFDKKILTWVFYSGLVLAVIVYVGALTAFRLWWPGQHT